MQIKVECQPKLCSELMNNPVGHFMLLSCHPEILHAVVVEFDGRGVPPDPLDAPLKDEPLLGDSSAGDGAVPAVGKFVEGGVEAATLEGLVEGGSLV